MTAPSFGCCAPTPRGDQKTAIAFIGHVLAKLTFQVERIKETTVESFGASFHWHLSDAGVDHVRIKPHTPPLNGREPPPHRLGREFCRPTPMWAEPAVVAEGDHPLSRRVMLQSSVNWQQAAHQLHVATPIIQVDPTNRRRPAVARSHLALQRRRREHRTTRAIYYLSMGIQHSRREAPDAWQK
jgi:hypothetical protein